MSDEKILTLNELIEFVETAIKGVDAAQRLTILQRLGATIKHNMVISAHVLKDEFKLHGIELQLDICKRCGSENVKDKMRCCPVCQQISHVQCFLTEHKCCRRCVKPE
jgi:hypothetical protein